jgi:hypothetical protein
LAVEALLTAECPQCDGLPGKGLDAECWVPTVQETDALLVNGGDALYL